MHTGILPVTTQFLGNRNTLAVQATSHFWVDWNCQESLLTSWADLHRRFANIHCYGEGSNLLILGDIDRLCVHSSAQLITVISQQDSNIEISIDAGVSWDKLVQHCLDNKWYGLENLTYIPGSCGAAPVQNIGAYGREFSDVCTWVEYLDWDKGSIHRIPAEECHFNYRSSLFKRQPRWIITRIGIGLSRMPKVYNQHSSLQKAKDVDTASPEALAAFIKATRKSKLPNPSVTPNAGSFFHNPIVITVQYQRVIDAAKQQNAAWPVTETTTKLSAAWLIEQCFPKGYIDPESKQCGISKQHSLCLVNMTASGKQIYDFAQHIIQAVNAKFNTLLQIEPTCIGAPKD